METLNLNLANKQSSQVDYTISRFPDGQQTIDIENITKLYKQIGDQANYTILIKSRLNNFKDLELILCATAAIKELGFTNISLYTPYFIGARSDRKFQDGGINYLKTVICPIINAQGYKSVSILDPHSSVLEACLNNFVEIDNSEFVLNTMFKQGFNRTNSDDYVLVSPDAGALKKVFKIQQKLEIPNMLIGAKNRDIKGQITHTSISGFQPNYQDKTFLIIDDICDGGRTFIELAKVIKGQYGNTAKIILAITHGIFTKGLQPLEGLFEHIYTTNSVKDDNYVGAKVTVFDTFNI